jgi:hypothetical protein
MNFSFCIFQFKVINDLPCSKELQHFTVFKRISITYVMLQAYRTNCMIVVQAQSHVRDSFN